MGPLRKGIVLASISNRLGRHKGNIEKISQPLFSSKPDPAWGLYFIAPTLLSPRYTLGRKVSKK